MLRVLWRLSRGYRLRPWQSPYLRWRIETYWGLHADEIHFRVFWKFVWRHRGELRRYAEWAVRSAERTAPERSRLNAASGGAEPRP